MLITMATQGGVSKAVPFHSETCLCMSEFPTSVKSYLDTWQSVPIMLEGSCTCGDCLPSL